MKILVMGLPGSGKTTFAKKLTELLGDVEHLNGDELRKVSNDWDFSPEGRLRQATRMQSVASKSKKKYVICDFVCPLPEMRATIKADWVVWMDTIEEGRFEDTNRMFVPPETYDFRITEQNANIWAAVVSVRIKNNMRRPVFQSNKETVQMLGRWQPWHAGHRALFERAIAKTGQVCIMIRDCQGWNDSNPFSAQEVINAIKRDLEPVYQGMFQIVVVPNIVNITYGRDVGYKIEQEAFDASITSISATKIREQMGL
jgi:hypothetical protein